MNSGLYRKSSKTSPELNLPNDSARIITEEVSNSKSLISPKRNVWQKSMNSLFKLVSSLIANFLSLKKKTSFVKYINREASYGNSDLPLSDPRFLLTEMSAVLTSGGKMRDMDALRLCLSVHEKQRRESIRSQCIDFKIPFDIALEDLPKFKSELNIIKTSVHQWKREHPDDPLVKELLTLLDSRCRTIKMLSNP